MYDPVKTFTVYSGEDYVCIFFSKKFLTFKQVQVLPCFTYCGFGNIFLDNIGIRHLWTTHSLLPRLLVTARLPTHQVWKTDHWPPLEPAEHCPRKPSICFDNLFHFWMFPFLVIPQQSICLDISYFMCFFSHTSCKKSYL